MLKNFFLSERRMLVVVALNAALIYAMYFPGMELRPLVLLDMAFIILFIIEAAVKIWAYTPRGYFSDYWNRFDFTIVAVSLPTLIVPFVDVPNTGFFIILRLFRLVRIARLLRFIPNMQDILSGLGRAMKASIFVLAAMVFLVFVFAIVTCHFYRGIAPEYFGDPLISLYSIFKMFTLEGWYEIPEAIAQKTGKNHTWLIGVTRFYFGMIVLLGGIFGMSLANAVFVDEMTMDNTRPLEAKVDELREEIAELKQMIRERQS